MMLFMDDPYSTNDVGNMFDTYFQSFYTIEMSLKIFALGFIWNEGSYLRIGWNILDFFIVVTGFMPYVMDSNNMRFSGLRILRVLRPLKTISSLPHLKMILSSLFNAFPMIMNAVFLLFFCLLIYAITALQLLMGSLKKRCFNQQTGLLVTQYFDISYSGFLCGFSDCPDPSLNICGKQLDSPNGSISNFDTVFWSLLMMFQNITLENWSVNMYYVARTFNYYMVFFFISLAFVGAMILFNLLASIISQAYEEQSKNFNFEKTVKDLETKKETAVGLEEIKQLKFCEKYHHKRMDRRKNILKDYGVTDNHVFVPKADDLRWQDILDLKLQKMETKKIKPIEAHNEMQELIKDLDEVFPLRKDNNENDTITNDNKNNLGIKTPPRKHQQYTDFDINFKDNSNDGISPNIKSELKLHFMGMKINETDHNTLAPIYENTQNNIFTLNSPEEKNLVVKNELSLKKTEKYDKKSTKFERIIQNSLSLSSHKKNSFTSPQNIGSPDDKNLEEYSSSISSKAFLKIRTLGKLLKSRTVSLFQKKPKLNIKIIDYMLMVDFSKIYESDSLNDVLVDVITERKLWAQRQLELKLNDFKCNVEYKTNDIDTKELFSKNVKKQTMIMTNLPGMGKPEKRMKNPLLLKQLLYGKNMKKYENSTKHNKNVHNKNTIIIGSVLRIPILGCSNYFLQIKWKKQMKKMKIPDFNGNNSLLKTNNKRRKIKKRIIKKEKTRIFHYKELKNLVKQTLNENYDHEEVAKEFNFENEYMEIKVLFLIYT